VRVPLRMMPDLLQAVARSVARLAQGRELLGFLRKLRDSAAAIRLNLFLAMPELRGTRRLRATAWRTVAYRTWNDLDFEFMPWRRHSVQGLERLRECLAEGRGVIACSLHLGAYRRVYYELVRQGFDVTLVADDRVASTLAATTRAQLLRQHAPAAEIARLESGLTVLDATVPGMVRRIFAALDRNSIVLIYIDGNTGARWQGSDAAPNTTVIELFGQQLAVRHGACQIAHAKQVPMVPIVAWWQAGLRPAMTCLPPIVPSPALPAAEFCRRTLQRLFTLAEDEIRSDPAQFEHWMYLHRWWSAPRPAAAVTSEAVEAARLELSAAGDGARYRVDRGRVLVLRLGERRVLVDAVRGSLVEAGRLLADLVQLLGRRRSYRGLRARLWPRYPGAELLAALAQLKAWGMLVEAPD
jgi:lauroyl/myristoyl acyltransferase